MVAQTRTTYAYCEHPLPYAPGESPFHIKGEFYRLVAASVAHHDAKSGGAVTAVLERGGLREFVSQTFLASALYDVLPLPRLTMAIAKARGFDVHELTTRMGEAAVKAQLAGTYGKLVSTMTPANFHQTFDRVIGQFYDFGPMTIEPRPSGARVVRTGMPLCVAEWWSLVTIPFVGVPLETKGASEVSATWKVWQRGEDRVVWDVQWKAS